MDFEKIESDYKNELDELKRQYLEEEKKPTKEQYLKRLKEVRETYYMQMQKYIDYEKKRIARKPRKRRVRKERLKNFKAQTVDFQDTFFKRMQLKYQMSSFRFKIVMKRMGGTQMKANILYMFIRIKVLLKRIGRSIDDFKQRSKNTIISTEKRVLEYMRIKLVFLRDKMKELLKKIKASIKNKLEERKRRKALKAESKAAPEVSPDQSKSKDPES